MNVQVVEGRLAAAVADGGTFAVSYPSHASPDVGSTDEGAFYGAMEHSFVLGQSALDFPTEFDLTFTTTTITVTNRSGSTWAAGTDWRLELRRPGKQIFSSTGRTINRAARADGVLINLGAPDAADADGIAASQTPAAAGNLTLASSTVTLDVPRNVTETGVVATTAHDLTVTGKDEYGETIVETITGAVGATTVAGKKAFKQITKIAVSAGTGGAVTVGWGDVLGLPVFLPSAAHVLKELQDGVAATAGTLVPGIRVAGGSTATAGDVRGTYDPNAAADGDKVFQLIAALPDPQYKGIAQYTA